jgi:predicted PurR-regulated permease PerM
MEKEDKRIVVISTGTIVRVLLFGLLLYALFILRDIVLVVLTAVVFASFAEAAIRRFKRIGVGRMLSVVLVYLILILLFSGLFYLFVPILITETSHLIDFLSPYISSPGFQGTADSFNDASNFVSSLSSTSLADFAVSIEKFAASVSGGFFASVVSIFGGLVNVILILIISFYLSIQENGIQKFLRIVTPPKHENYVIGLWDRTQHKIALWLKGQMILGVIVAVMMFIILSLLGIPYALLLAIATGMFELIPFGVTLAMIPATGFAYVQGGLKLAIAVFISYVVVQQIENYVFQPLVVKRVVGISPLVVILSVLAGFELAGFWGLILAIPVTVALLEYVDDIEKKKVAFEDGHA